MTSHLVWLSTKSTSNSSPSQVVIVIFLAKTEKTFSTVPHPQVVIYTKLEKPTPHAYIYAQQSAAYPPVLEELEEYKNNFIFSQDS
jgi:hypothetical protein